MKKIAVLLAALLMVLFMAPPANAGNGWPGGYVRHDANDSGYNQPIVITCNWDAPENRPDLVTFGWARWLGLGAVSKDHCRDADGIYVYAGTQVSCHYPGMPWINTLFDATGWHKISNIDMWVCVNQLD